MIRFPNPGSTIGNLLHIYKVVYSSLKEEASFSLDDITKVMTDSLLASSSGYVGEKALEKSTRKDRSRDPLYNQSKMYAEIFRSLGWISSTSNSALTFCFTELGKYAGEADDIDPLFEESILGIVYPNDVLDAKSNVASRPFLSILKTLDKLGGYLYRDEMIIGPMSYDDDSNELLNKINEILLARPDFKKLQELFSNASKSLGIQENTMQNYTRFPISVLEYCGWIEKESNSTVYSSKVKLMKLTQKGKDLVVKLDLYHDERMEAFQKRKNKLKKALANVGFYGMLDRGGYDISKVLDTLKSYEKELNDSKISGDVIFSPYQTIKKSDADELLDIKGDKSKAESVKKVIVAEAKTEERSIETDVTISTGYDIDFTQNDFTNKVIEMSKTMSICNIADNLFNSYKNSKKEVFYSLIGFLFNTIGFKCKVSRGGVNYERFDAIIVDDKKSIPIEIKSPTEEEHLSIKGVRQALENKIILLSRKTYSTTKDITSLVVCYKLPNSRAEVSDLISAIKHVYGFKIGVVDFKSLLMLSVTAIVDKKIAPKSEIEQMEGFINVRTSKK